MVEQCDGPLRGLLPQQDVALQALGGGWLPGGYAARLACAVAVAVAGAALAGWATRRPSRPGRPTGGGPA